MSEARPIELWVRWSFRDVYRAHLWSAFRSWFWFLVPFGALAKGMKLRAKSFGRTPLAHLNLLLWITFGFAVLLLFVFPLYMTRRFFRDTQVAGNCVHCLFQDTGVQISPGAILHPWSAFVWARETRRAFLLGSRRGYYWVLPKSRFVSEQQVAEFRELMRAHFPAAKLAKQEPRES